MAFETAAYIRQVAKGHLKHNRFSCWRDLSRAELEKALTKSGRRSGMRCNQGCSWELPFPFYRGCAACP